MPFWLMHTYSASKLGIFSLPKNEQNLFFLGNFSPDWTSFYEGEQRGLRAKSHFLYNNFSQFRLETFIEDFYEKAKSEEEKLFLKGYAYHMTLDWIWSSMLYAKHGFNHTNKRDYYEECSRWDAWIEKQPIGMDCINVLADKSRFKEISSPDESLISPYYLGKVKDSAVLFSKERPVGEPEVFSLEEIEAIILQANMIYFENFSKI